MGISDNSSNQDASLFRGVEDVFMLMDFLFSKFNASMHVY